MKHLEVPADSLRWELSEAVVGFASTAEIAPIAGTIAQERAVEALRMGIENNAPGFNIFVSGITGTGRSSTVAGILRTISPQCRIAPDRVYVHNFDDPDRPRLLSFPRGQAVRFAEEMRRLTRHLLDNVPRIFESQAFEDGRKEIVERHSGLERERLQAFERDLAASGLALAEIKIGEITRPEIVVRWHGRGIPLEALDQLVDAKEMEEEEAAKLRAAHMANRDRLHALLKATRGAVRGMAAEMEELVRRLGTMLIEGAIEDIAERFRSPQVEAYLGRVRDFVLGNLELFQPRSESSNGEMVTHEEAEPPLQLAVNVLLDNSHLQECPIIMEPRPSYRNLFGVIERVSDRMGGWHTDFTRIHAGSLLRADGGALVLNAQDVLTEPWVWPTLKNVLRFRQLEIQNPAQLIALGAEAISPEPIPVDVKVVLIGDFSTYQLLAAYDPEFEKIFKILAHFDSSMDATPENIRHFAGLVSRICSEENLLHLDASGFTSLLEHATRRIGRRGKLPTRFGDVADLVREADYYARKEMRPAIDQGMIDMAASSQRRRHSLIEEKLQEEITSDNLMISTQGRISGQINGLAVYDMRAYRFGKPVRVTVSTGVGAAGLINIERESGLSGQTHDKGVMILAGYLRRTYAQAAPLVLSASIAFEQSYGMIDGDSASSTELFALLSDLAEAPIDQGIAVTGSLNQRGEIQPIGGVNEKIESFFDLCAERGLTGTQGVIIPHQNVPDLQLKEPIIDAVRAGKFRIWAIASVDQGIEILTGLPAREVHRRVRERLDAFAHAIAGASREISSAAIPSIDSSSGTPPSPPPSTPPLPVPPPPRDPGEPG